MRLVFDKYFRYQMVAFSYRGSEPAEQHKALLEAALKRDAAPRWRPCACMSTIAWSTRWRRRR